jgi:hypothetical protein
MLLSERPSYGCSLRLGQGSRSGKRNLEPHTLSTFCFSLLLAHKTAPSGPFALLAHKTAPSGPFALLAHKTAPSGPFALLAHKTAPSEFGSLAALTGRITFFLRTRLSHFAAVSPVICRFSDAIRGLLCTGTQITFPRETASSSMLGSHVLWHRRTLY